MISAIEKRKKRLLIGTDAKYISFISAFSRSVTPLCWPWADKPAHQ